MRDISIDLAKAAVQKHASDNNFSVIFADDPRRTGVIYTMAAIHKALNTGFDLETAKQSVSVTLPGAGVAELLLQQIPVVGQVLHFFAKDLSKTTVFYSPAAMSSGAALISTHMHEIGHVGSIAKGGFLWCVCYGLLDVVRAAGEAPCYGASIAIDHSFAGKDLDQAELDANASMRSYGLSQSEYDFAKSMVRSNVLSLKRNGDPGGVIADAKRILTDVGWRE